MIKSHIKSFANNAAWILSTLVPKTNKIVIVGGWFGERFADNSKAMYLYLYKNKSSLGLQKVIYITKNKGVFNDLNSKGYSVLMYNTPMAIWYHLRAKIHIVDQGPIDINRLFSIKAKKINLWHGFALKKVNYMLDKGKKSLEEIISISENRVEIGNWNEAYFLSQSPEHSNQLQWMFGLEEQKLIHGIFPRTVYMVKENKKYYLDEEIASLEKLQEIKKRGKKILFYLPTFRDNELYNNQCIDTIIALDGFLVKNDAYLITKFHFAAVGTKGSKSISDHIINLSTRSDVYNFIEYADVLITDYSSVYFDFMLLDRPIVFYPFDIEYYQNSDRGFIYNYNSFTPGTKALNKEELEKGIFDSLYNKDIYMEKYNIPYNEIKDIVYGRCKPTFEELNSLWSRICKL